ncbi:phosphopantetheine-binding protein, partial [Massilia sp.]|uniref:phosphopantetheine-binding protein n=1 Tax=Massilia sp. TaxID=1882437 RepID=UPI00352C8A48
LEAFPLTANGKIDKKALPEPDLYGTDHYSPPTTPTEQRLAVVWAELLKLPPERIGRDADFYSLGGDSLLTVRLIAAIREHFQVELPLSEIFSGFELSSLAARIARAQEEETTLSRHAALLSSHQNTKSKRKKITI